MGKLLDLKFAVDHRLLSGVNVVKRLSALRLSGAQRRALRTSKSKWSGSLRGKRCLVCGNGPSLGEIDFEAFRDVPTFAGNYFYKAKNAASLNPQYYFIIDSKLISGIWPVSMIDEIFEVFPTVNLFLDVRWMNHALLKPYAGNENIYWILPSQFPHAYLKPPKSMGSALCNLNVVSCAVTAAAAMGANKIAIAGVDGDGLFREILDMESHHYQSAKDHSMRNFTSMVQSLMLSTENLWAWKGIVENFAKHGIQIVNVCQGGIMNCMPRISPAEFLEAADNSRR